MSTKKQSLEYFIEAEVFLSLILSIAFIIITLNLDKGFWGSDYFTGFLRFYGGMSIIFFASVFVIGIPGAIKSKPSGNVIMAIICSIACWLLSLILTAITASFLYLFSAYIMLLGIIFGFYYGLKLKVKKVSKSSAIADY